MPHHASQALDMRLTGAGIGWRKAEDLPLFVTEEGI
jgi:hypothetical protein